MNVLRFSAAAVSLLMFACTAAYNPPSTKKQILEQTVSASKSKIFTSAIQVFRKSGFRIAFTELEQGRVSTRPKTLKLTADDCDCGGIKGRKFAPDQGTTTDVSYLVLARDGAFTLSCVISGQYVASDTSMVKRFECVSTGRLEQDMLRKIRDAAADNAAADPEPSAY
jgi:hypothetical protein